MSRFVIKGIESVRFVFKTIAATRNAVRPTQLSQTKALPVAAMGETGLKAAIIGRKPIARTYWPQRNA